MISQGQFSLPSCRISETKLEAVPKNSLCEKRLAQLTYKIRWLTSKLKTKTFLIKMIIKLLSKPCKKLPVPLLLRRPGNFNFWRNWQLAVLSVYRNWLDSIPTFTGNFQLPGAKSCYYWRLYTLLYLVLWSCYISTSFQKRKPSQVTEYFVNNKKIWLRQSLYSTATN